MGAEAAFRANIEAAGLRTAEIIADGQLHRCPTVDKPGANDGAYLLFSDDPPAGYYLNWRTGQEGRWCAAGNGQAPTEAQRQAWEAARREREAAQAIAWAEAARRARHLLSEARTCTGHAYLKAKGCKPCQGLKLDQEGRLLVPVLGADGKPQSLQTITPDGEKRFLPGGRMAGGYFAIKGGAGPLAVCEGLATGLSLAEAMGLTVLVAFTAGNLEAVARMARERYPEREITLAGDDDHATDGNPGASKARAAALAVGGKLALPVFAQDGAGTDFNDLHQAEGLEVVKAQVEAAQAPELDQDHVQRTQAQESTPLPGPPAGWPFRVSDEGVFKRIERENKQTGELDVEWLRVCSRLDVLAETRDAQGRAWGRLLAVHTREGQVNEWAMPMELLAGDGTAHRAELLNLGLELAPGNIARNALHEYIATARPPERARCVDRMGWHGPAFILPDAAYGVATGERTLYQAARVGDQAFQVAGTLEGWQEQVGRLCVGNSRLAFAVSTAFAAPLLHLASLESGGFHLRGASSLGKTTALLVAGSVWGGGGVGGYCRTWRATANGLEGVALAHCDALLCLDEMGQVDGREAGETAYMLANGQGKTRSRKDGQARPPAKWRVLFLGTGELSLADKMSEVGRRVKAGQEVRLVDLPADAGAGLGLFEVLHEFDSARALADHLHQAVGAFYGAPARAFLERITADMEGMGQTVNEVVRAFVDEFCPAGADGQVLRVAGRFGLVAAAGELAGAVNVLPWPADEAKRAAGICFQAWLNQRGGPGAQEARAGLAQVVAFFQRHGASRFEPWDGADRDRPINNRAGFRREAEGGGREFFLFPEIFRAEVASGFDPRALARELIRLGLLLPGTDGKPASVHKPPAIGKPTKLYRFTSEVLGEGDDHA